MADKAIKAHLITGGQYHDIDYARLTLLQMLSTHEDIRTTVAMDYQDLSPLDHAACLITYTCNVVPDSAGVAKLSAFLERGGRWLALHGTNSLLALNENKRWYAPMDDSGFMALLGSQFAAHPPIEPYLVEVVKKDDPLIRGIDDFEVEGGDELYYMRIFGEIEVLMEAKAQGAARGFVEREWDADSRHPVMYRKSVGEGEIVYCTLGHRRGHYDLEPLLDFYPDIEKGAWDIAPYMEILNRCLIWAKGG